jgi:hypothetical protein
MRFVGSVLKRGEEHVFFQACGLKREGEQIQNTAVMRRARLAYEEETQHCSHVNMTKKENKR